MVFVDFRWFPMISDDFHIFPVIFNDFPMIFDNFSWAFQKKENWQHTLNQVTARARMKPKRRLLPWPPLEDCVWPRFSDGFPYTPLGIRPNQHTIKHACLHVWRYAHQHIAWHLLGLPGTVACHAMSRWPLGGGEGGESGDRQKRKKGRKKNQKRTRTKIRENGQKD